MVSELYRKNKNQRDAYSSPWSKKEAIMIRIWEVVWTLFVRWLPTPFYRWHIFLLNLFGAHISGHPFIAPTARIYAPWLLTVGDRSCIATRSEIYNLGPVIIKERVTIAQYAYICNGSHDLSDNKLPLVVGDVVIDNDVFIGARAIILPGLHLCRYSVVGAGAVLTQNTTDFGIYAGNPARFIKERKIYGE